MKRLHFEITINAPRQKVWEIMLADKTYRQWTDVFSPGSYYQGDWSKGNKIRFIGPDEDGEERGMLSQIEENKPGEFVSIKHLGVITNGHEDTSSEAIGDWAGALENYTFSDAPDGGTLLQIDVDTDEQFVDDFGNSWPKALDKLKEIVEAETSE